MVGTAAALLSAAAAAGCGDARAPELRSPSFAAAEVPAFGDPGATVDAWADVDGDGDPDRFVGFRDRPARLYRNDGLGGFEDGAEAAGLVVERPVTAAAWGDHDGDGDPDLLLGLAGGSPSLALWRNDGGTFVEVTEAVGLAAEAVGPVTEAVESAPDTVEAATGAAGEAGAPVQATWADVDTDGDLDLFVAVGGGRDRLWRNDGGWFRDVSSAAGMREGRGSAAAAFLDADGDGDLDLFSVDAAGGAPRLLRNRDGVFVRDPDGVDPELAGGEIPGGAAGPAGLCVADADGDGRPDLHLARSGGSVLLRNPGAEGGPWRDVAAELGLDDVPGPSCAWGDVDHDGRVEVAAVGSDGSVALRRPGSRNATPLQAAGPSDGARPGADRLLLLDADGDGDLDLARAGSAGAGHPLLVNLLRPEFSGHALRVQVVDRDGRATRAGAVVRLLVPGSRTVVASGVVQAGSGGVQSELPVHLGVPGGQPVQVEVVVPGAANPDTTSVGPVVPAEHRGGLLEVRAGG